MKQIKTQQSFQISRAVNNAIACYRELIVKKKLAPQSWLVNFWSH
jgi:hypothetical protein